VNVNGVKVGYMRVSTADGSQKFDMQETALIEAGVSPDKIYSDMASGASDNREGMKYMLKSLNSGDTVVVWKLDRLGRNVKYLVNIIDELIKKNVHLEILTGACHGINMTTPEGRMFFHMAATFAQFERDLIRERIVAGIAEAQRRGTKSGRKFKFSKYDIQTIQHMIKASVPKAEIARRFHVTTQTIFNYFTPEGEIKQRG
jgi:DNA invertase Pin-like site-specific DNA recombinase